MTDAADTEGLLVGRELSSGCERPADVADGDHRHDSSANDEPRETYLAFSSSSRRTKTLAILFALLLGLVAAMIVAIGVGPTGWSRLNVVWNIRVPRVLLAALVGAGLAMSGGALQGVVRNPLADPTMIGVSGGAALGAV
ncbi:MAG TPA: iron chelate uptake ABC transporter family permease subunit, partial [Kofleriaceae bacterium]